MKITFSPDELRWLHGLVSSYLQIARRAAEPAEMRIAAKMRYKFTPNSSYVNLTGKERAFLASAVAFRAGHLPTGLDSPEIPVLRGLATKLGGQTS